MFEKYIERLKSSNSIGLRYCLVDKKDIDKISEIFTEENGYYLSKDTNGYIYLNWE